MAEHVIWVEKYRPHKISDCVLPENIKETFAQIVKQGLIPNLILTGKAGGGKTTAARAICDELNVESILINASENGNIDTLRNEIREFASTESFLRDLDADDNSSVKRKVVILDEADHLNPNSTQPALRSFIEEFASNVSFIFTCNSLGKIIQPLHSRTSVIEYNIPNGEKATLQGQFYKRLKFILDTENVEFDPNVVKALVVKFWPDFRRTINELQRYSLSGKIDEGILAQVRDVPLSELIKALKDKDFQSMRKWCAVHHDSDSVKIIRKLYEVLYEVFNKNSIPDVVILMGRYQYQAAFVNDHELHLVAFLTELMYGDAIQEA
jgi:DNA polymerase III delta prime subunit